MSYIATAPDKVTALENAEMAIKCDFPSGWRAIRIGVLATIPASSAIPGTPYFFIGLSVGTTNLRLSATSDGVAGVRFGGTFASFTYSTAGGGYVNPERVHPNTKLGATDSVGAALNSSTGISVGLTNRTPLYVDVCKTTSRVRTVSSGSGTPADRTEAQMNYDMMAATPGGLGTAAALPVSISTWAFDSICIAWMRSDVPFRVHCVSFCEIPEF